MEAIVKFTPETLFHTVSHFMHISKEFQSELFSYNYSPADIEKQIMICGSKFLDSFALSPRDVMTMLEKRFRSQFEQIVYDSDGRFRGSFQFDSQIGICGVVKIKDLTDEERANITYSNRGEVVIHEVKLKRHLYTNICNIVLSYSKDGPSLVTLFPGIMAPPISHANIDLDPSWNEYVFTQYIN